ncbi:FkbM family methyltransferase [Candidatus Gracilibacteria bacterium]|nr:FkbM family methyltransferase [Candidatus Gracilibacteria bacterium]NJM88632.1 FkbM family methyltransferase [Hydrococcus sp. RU_2_2]NJP20623.1 FkbM family methyltransferase [Hydrococcus sp. CRU_1_1]
MGLKNITWTILSLVARSLPLSWLESLPSKGKLGHFARVGLIKRDLTIKHGVAAGLKFNAGAYNLDTALGTYEMSVQETLSQYLKPGDIFYDIGANVGFFTILAAKLVGSSGKVYAFEPEAVNVATLQHNIQINRFTHVSAIAKAVSRTTGQAELLLAAYSGGHTLATVGSRADARDIINIDVVSIDDLLKQKEIDPPTLVKIDVEGAEIDVLYGMTQTIQEYQPIILYEVDDRNKEIMLSKREEIASFLREYGYEIENLADAYPKISWNVGHAIAIPKGKQLHNS